MEEQKMNTIIRPNSQIKSYSYLHYSSSKKSSKANKLIYLDFDDKLNYRKKFKESKNDINYFEVKINSFISNKTIDSANKKLQCKVNNLLIPVNNIQNSNNNEKYISKQKPSSKLKTNAEFFSQNAKIVNIMKEKPPKLPELFLNDFTLNDKLIEKSNETYAKLNQGTIPVAFYNHLIISEENKKFVNNKHKYLKASLTQRNKKKLLTIIYYSPKYL